MVAEADGGRTERAQREAGAEVGCAGGKDSHGWPVDSPDVYTVVAHRDPDGIPHPTCRVVRTVAA